MTDWNDILRRISEDFGARFALLVKCGGGPEADADRRARFDREAGADRRAEGASEAFVEFWTRAEDPADEEPGAEGGWRLAGSGAAYIGRCGLGKEREGDAKSPEGELRVRRAFGILPNPGTSIEYLQVSQSTVACDCEGPYYNQIVEMAPGITGEKMFEMAPEYNYGLELDFNPENIYPLGSAIFFHCKGSKPYTGGCVAVDEDFLRSILLRADFSLIVSIH